ncbi:hypothetical protein V8F06_006653 [Rhypophila decipiens]
MRAFTTVLLTLATIVNAAPSGGKAVDTPALQARKECIYDCLCSDLDAVPGETEQCCATVGGNYDGSRFCKDMPFPNYTTFQGCCTEGAVVCSAPNGCPA